MIFVEKPAGEVERGTALVKTFPNWSISEGLNGFVLEGSVEVFDILAFENRVEQNFLHKFEELLLVSFETTDPQHDVD